MKGQNIFGTETKLVWLYLSDDLKEPIYAKYDKWSKHDDATACVVVQFNSQEDREIVMDLLFPDIKDKSNTEC